MDDIIFSLAWNCGEKDCEVGWHKSSYWAYDDGSYSVDSYSDGDHEGINERDLPSNEEVEQSWHEYAKDVAATGKDPLGEYYVRGTSKVRERWHFKFNKSIVGPVLLFARHAGREYRWNELPEHIATYLNIEKTARLRDFDSWKAFEETVPGVRAMRWMLTYIEREKPRNPATVARELKRIARRKLKAA